MAQLDSTVDTGRAISWSCRPTAHCAVRPLALAWL